MKADNNNIILTQICTNNDSFSFKEVIPVYEDYKEGNQILIKNEDGNICWTRLDLSLNVIVSNSLKNYNIYYDKGRVGVGRSPLFNYKVDVAIPKDTIITALHIGDGSFGFSLGNGTSNGFIPEIIGIGSDENDAGLYFVGIAGTDKTSSIPLILMDGRNQYNEKLTNRPIFGITSANYNEYSILVDYLDNLIVKGNITFNNISLLEKIEQLEKEINNLKTKIT